jgi:hypothetical protein
LFAIARQYIPLVGHTLVTGWTNLNVFFATSSSAFADGLALDMASPDYVFDDFDLAGLQLAAGWTSGASILPVTLDFGTELGSYIHNMTGNSLYVWFDFDSSAADPGAVYSSFVEGYLSRSYSGAQPQLEILG